MSYARFGWEGSDVYVYLGRGGYECCGCHLDSQGWWYGKSTDAIVGHLKDHQAAGHTVPPSAFEEIEASREEDSYFIEHGVWP
jgi:hypothetical protein